MSAIYVLSQADYQLNVSILEKLENKIFLNTLP